MKLEGIRYCSRCVMPDTKPDLTLDGENVCSACRLAEQKNEIDWEKRRQELHGILEKYRSKDGSNYDCIVPVSGGKDSHYQTYIIREVFKLNPLLVTWHPCKRLYPGTHNIKNIKEAFSVDHVEFTANPSVYRRLFRLGFEETGDPCWPCHVGIFTFPVRVAIQYNVPLLIWGENSQLEYGGPAADADNPTLDRRWVQKYGLSVGGEQAIDPISWCGRYGLTKNDLIPYIYPEESEIKRVGVTGIFLGYYLKWDVRLQVKLMKTYGFKARDERSIGTYTNYENVDCGFVDIHDYLKYVKFGFGRATDHACIDIRNGRLARDEATRLVRKFDGEVKNVKEFCNFIGVTEEYFWEVVERFRNPEIWKKNEKDEWMLRNPIS